MLRKRKRAKYSGELFFEIIKRHIEDRSSCRVIAKRLQETTHSFLSAATVCNYVKEASLKCRRLIDLVEQLKPGFSGFLHLDGKGIKVKGRNKHAYSLFIGQDANGLPIHQCLMEGENRLAIGDFLEEIGKQLHYPFKGIISDMNENIISAVSEKMPNMPHQFCATHVLRNIDKVIGYQHYQTQMIKHIRRLKSLRSVFIWAVINKKTSVINELNTVRERINNLKTKYKDVLILRRRLRSYVLSDSWHKAEGRLLVIKRLAVHFRSSKKIALLLRSLIKYKNNLFCYLKYPYMPYTNNLLENLIRQYERRLKTIEGFGGDLKAINGYLNLMAICQCFKPYTDCREHNKQKNGKSPLEIAGVSVTGLDWVKIALK